MNKEHVELNLAIFKLLNPGVVVEKVWFGRWREHRWCKIINGVASGFVPDPAGDWAAMGALIEEMKNRRYYIDVCVYQFSTGEYWFGFMSMNTRKMYDGRDAFLPHAVALAARQALEAQGNEPA